jgi:hypothetical protein
MMDLEKHYISGWEGYSGLLPDKEASDAMSAHGEWCKFDNGAFGDCKVLLDQGVFHKSCTLPFS